MANTWPSTISMAKRSNSPAARSRRFAIAAALAIIVALAARPLLGCPFCTPLKPTLCQRAAEAAVTALVEVESRGRDGQTRVKVHRAIQGADRLGKLSELTIPLDLAARPGALLIVFGSGPPEAAPPALEWHAESVNETSYAYFAKAPKAGGATAARLEYFARFLEHAEPLVAEDAYLEFAHAPFDLVTQVAPRLPLERMRAWVVDARIPPHRKGFYALALGLAPGAGERRANAELLRKLIVTPEDDFRAGFDGILGSYLLLEGTAGLALVESRYLANAEAADGDVRHALAALRFYHEYGRGIPPARLDSAVRQLLARPEFAEAAVTDLARWRDWQALEQIVKLYARPEFSQPATRRAIVGYLLACPEAKATGALDALRKLDPQGVAEAEQVLSRTSSVPKSD
jgi:hypothetical protein